MWSCCPSLEHLYRSFPCSWYVYTNFLLDRIFCEVGSLDRRCFQWRWHLLFGRFLFYRIWFCGAHKSYKISQISPYLVIRVYVLPLSSFLEFRKSKKVSKISTATTNSLSGIVFTKNRLSPVVKKNEPLLPALCNPLNEFTFPLSTELKHSLPSDFKYYFFEIWLKFLIRVNTRGA